MKVVTDKVVVIDGVLAQHPPHQVDIPSERIPDADRIIELITQADHIINAGDLRNQQVRRLSRIRELLSRVA